MKRMTSRRKGIGFEAGMILRRTRMAAALLSVCLVAGAGEASTLLHYAFTENGGDTVADLSGNGRHGTLGGFASTNAGAGVFGASEGWVAGGGLSFLDDNVDCSYVSTPLTQGALLANGSFTIEFTASADGPSGWGPAIGRNPGFGPSVYIGPDGWEHTTLYVNIGWWEQGTATVPWTLPGDGSDPASHHVALVFTKNEGANGGVFEVFIDGVSAGTWTAADNLAAGSPTFCIGNTTLNATRNGNEQWDGVIYGVAFSDQALSPSSFVLVNASLALDRTTVAENQTTGTVVGALSTVGAGSGPFTYSLVAGDGDAGNALFRIDGDTLKTAGRFDYESTNSYSIRVRSEGGTKPLTNVFAIAVTNVPEDYMMVAGAHVVAGTTAVGTLRTSGDSPTAGYAISGGTDSNRFEWAAPGSGELRMKSAPGPEEIGRKYYVEVTATDGATPVPNAAKILIEASVVPLGTPRKGLILIMQ